MELSKTNKYHQPIYEKLDHFYQSNKIPHIIFHGSSGSGKRTIVDNFVLKIYQNDKKKIKTN
jgi:DNA polymerase III delta prime subunit